MANVKITPYTTWAGVTNFKVCLFPYISFDIIAVTDAEKSEDNWAVYELVIGWLFWKIQIQTSKKF